MPDIRKRSNEQDSKMDSRMTCQEIMTEDPVYCLPTDAVTKAAEVMKRENVGPVPVVGDEKSRKLVGIITDRDLAIRVVAEGRDPRSTRIEEVMEKHLVVCHPEDDIEKVLDAMAKNQLRRIPVVDDEGSLLGIIAQADVATRLAQPATVGRVVAEISD